MSNRFDVIKENLRIDIFSLLTNSDVQMSPGTATCIAGDTYYLPSIDFLAFRYRRLREVAITDGKISMLKGDIFSGHLILPNSNDFPLHHGKYLGTPGMKVNAVVKLSLPCERILAITVWRIDLDM